MSNRLQHEKSPYLLQHMENPVDWYPWCDEAFERAEHEEKPIFLSIGYSTCHWCHVMAHECFEDEQVAKLLNEQFICIKVDREERPDIDSVYMSVCQAVTGSGGWPLTIIMTPDQRPFFAGTYFPKLRRYGQPGLIDILERAVDLWRTDRKELCATGGEIAKAISQRQVSGRSEPSMEMLDAAYGLLQRQFDPDWGGFSHAPKFPTPHNLLFLMEYFLKTAKSEALAMAEKTLMAMGQGGIHDMIGGGFSRYSTDEKWLIPHFEKMLYDNALLILAYLKAYQITGEETYAGIVRSTADYILRELTDADGGFYCGQDADSDGIEGKYYAFTWEEILSLLGNEDGQEFCRLYRIEKEGNFEGKSIPNRIGMEEEGWQFGDMRLKKLYDYRMKRTRLHKDDKVLLSWNAWTILALALAGQSLSEERYVIGARKAQEFIETYMRDENGRLFLRFRDKEAAYAGQLEDYAVYALSLLGLYSVTFQADYLKKAILLAGQMTELFEDKESGGYYMTPIDAKKLIMRPKETYDGAIPSGNSVAAVVLQKLSHLTGEMKWQEAAERQLGFLAKKLEEYPIGCSFALLAMTEALFPHKELICAVNGPVPKELTDYMKSHKEAGLSLLVKTKEQEKLLSECAPFTAGYPVPDKGAVYYLCENHACQTPTRDFSSLKLLK